MVVAGFDLTYHVKHYNDSWPTLGSTEDSLIELCRPQIDKDRLPSRQCRRIDLHYDGRNIRGDGMDEQLHWERIYKTKAPDAVSCIDHILKNRLNDRTPRQGHALRNYRMWAVGESHLVDDLVPVGMKT